MWLLSCGLCCARIVEKMGKMYNENKFMGWEGMGRDVYTRTF